ncbi:MAG TPA: winged helix-turn-helix domain-containing protein [Chitinophagaceae bacterium]|nr:winged helix-turn-helix domain-containing protein [Chitinophagaceae bacterium]
MKRITIVASCIACLLLVTAFIKTGENRPLEDEKIVALRLVGHNMLRQAGDSTSTLMPVQKISDNTFQLRFTRAFTFEPASLVSTVEAVFRKMAMPPGYLVKVVSGRSGETIYSYEVHGKPSRDIIPCLGRKQPAGVYNISITFLQQPVLSGVIGNYWLPCTGLLLALSAMVITLVYKKRRLPNVTEVQNKTSLGSYTLIANSDMLMYNGKATRLTAKEVKVLALFALRPNTIIERQELVKNIWEDEGVIVGARSLDVFISKLRKKMADDQSVSIVNVHGVGYKLQVTG